MTSTAKDKNPRPLTQIKTGISAVVHGFHPECRVVDRLLHMGLLPGATVTVRTIAPLGDPLALELNSTLLTLRKADARHVLVLPSSEIISS